MPKALIFGIHGQDGFYLDRLLREKQMEVTGVSRTGGNWLKGDVSDRRFTGALIRELRPDYIFHLAANSRTDHELLFEHQGTIVDGTLNILETVYHDCPDARVFITGSGLQFENTGDPVGETNAFAAQDAYSLARIQSVYAGRYFRTKGIRVYTGYLFHHDSPLRTAQHLNRKIADAAKAAAEGMDVRLEIGDISVEKEFGFAGDIVRGIYQLVSQDTIFEACIGTGKAYRIERWLEICFGLANRNWKDHVLEKQVFKPAFKRLVSDPSLIRSTGWEPTVSIEQLAALMVNLPDSKL
ncbi:MAG: GDP-mannose 4,6-dehydratase [Chitinophagaceae bacterium]